MRSRPTRGRWAALALVGVALGLACKPEPRRRGFCGAYADTVSECCAEHEYEHLKVICQVDLNTADAIGSGCGRATRDLFTCAEQVACELECTQTTPDPCAIERQAMVGICNELPSPPSLDP